jgi:hypothetical protein
MKKVIKIAIDSTKYISTNQIYDTTCIGCTFRAAKLTGGCSKYAKEINGFTLGPDCYENDSIFVNELENLSLDDAKFTFDEFLTAIDLCKYVISNKTHLTIPVHISTLKENVAAQLKKISSPEYKEYLRLKSIYE